MAIRPQKTLRFWTHYDQNGNILGNGLPRRLTAPRNDSTISTHRKNRRKAVLFAYRGILAGDEKKLWEYGHIFLFRSFIG